MSTGGVLGVGDGELYQGEVRIPAGMFVSTEGGDASLRSMLKSSVLLAGFERKASIPELKHSCFVESWQSALKAMTYKTKDMSLNSMRTSQATSLLGNASYPRSASSARIRLAASTPSHIGISETSSQLRTNIIGGSSSVRWSNIAAWKYPCPCFSQAAMASSPFVVAST